MTTASVARGIRAALLTGDPHAKAMATRAVARDWPVVEPADPAKANAVLMRAISLVGTPYRYGGNTPDGGFDCSGLVGFVFKDAANLALPRSTRELIDIDARFADTRPC